MIKNEIDGRDVMKGKMKQKYIRDEGKKRVIDV